jgi:hypothetical protein
MGCSHFDLFQSFPPVDLRPKPVLTVPKHIDLPTPVLVPPHRPLLENHSMHCGRGVRRVLLNTSMRMGSSISEML